MTTPLQHTSLGELGYSPLAATSLGELGGLVVTVPTPGGGITGAILRSQEPMDTEDIQLLMIIVSIIENDR